MSLALSDAQINHILLTTGPLQPKERAAFMLALFEDLLMGREEIGDGEPHHPLNFVRRSAKLLQCGSAPSSCYCRPPWAFPP